MLHVKQWLELNLRSLTGLVAGLKARAGLELEDAGKDDAGERLDGVVVVENAVVVALARVAHLVLGVFERGLQVCEVGVCLEVGIGFGHGKELTQGSGKSIVGFHLFVGRVCGDGGIAGGDNGLESLFLVLGVALDRLDQICDQVAAALELRVDVLPSVIDAIAQRNEVIVDANYRANDSDDNDDANDDRNHECSVSVMRHGEKHTILPRMTPTVYPSHKLKHAALARGFCSKKSVRLQNQRHAQFILRA